MFKAFSIVSNLLLAAYISCRNVDISLVSSSSRSSLLRLNDLISSMAASCANLTSLSV